MEIRITKAFSFAVMEEFWARPTANKLAMWMNFVHITHLQANEDMFQGRV